MASLAKAFRAAALKAETDGLQRPGKALRLFLFGGRGYMSLLLSALIKSSYSVVGLCAFDGQSNLIDALKSRVAKKLIQLGVSRKQSFIYEDPFNTFDLPADIARGHGIPTFTIEQLYAREFTQRYGTLRPDLAIVAGFPKLIPKAVFQLPRIATINFHPSLLPKHRGGTPNRWVVRNGERETGITVHHITEKFDSGEIIAQHWIGVGANDTWGDVEHRICAELPRVALDVIDRAAAGDILGVPQDETLASYEPSFRSVHQIINWHLESREIRQLCNAIRPKSGGLTFAGGRQYCVWDISTDKRQIGDGEPGEIIGFDGADYCPIVSCGDGTVCIKAFIEMGRIVHAGALAKRHRFAVGTVFGPVPTI